MSYIQNDRTINVEDHHAIQIRQFSKLQSYCPFISQLWSILLTSLKIILLQNRKLLLSVYVFTCVPLSLLITSLYASSRHLRAHIAHLEWLSNAIDIVVELENIEDEAREELSSLLRVKLIYGLPIWIFSLLSLTATVSATNQKWPRVSNVVAAMLTSVVNCAMWIAWAVVTWVVAAITGYEDNTTGNWAVAAVGMGFEVYLMAVLSVALVVSFREGLAGVPAVRAGWEVMLREGRIMGWVLSCLVLVGSGFIERKMRWAMDGLDFVISEYKGGWTVWMRYGYMGVLVMLLGLVMLWSYVVFTIFVYGCKKRLVVLSDRD